MSGFHRFTEHHQLEAVGSFRKFKTVLVALSTFVAVTAFYEQHRDAAEDADWEEDDAQEDATYKCSHIRR